MTKAHYLPANRCLLTAVVLLAFLLTLTALHALRHPPRVIPTTPALALRPRPGVHLARSALDDPALLATLADAGVRWVRVEVPWAKVEPQPGRYRWAPWDERFARLQRLGLTPVVTLNTSPGWARAPEDRDNPLAPPANPQDLAHFARALAARYGDMLRFYQIWHEPNIAPHWGNREADPLGYLRLLQTTAVTLRAADPDAVILSAGLAPTLDPGRVNRNDLAYLEDLYRLGADTWFDVLAWEPYGFGRPPEEPPAADRLNFRRVELARAIMSRYGDDDTPIWATAFGWNALPPGQESPWKRVSRQQQADYLRRALAWAAGNAPWLGPLFWTHARPDAPATDPLWGFALWRADGPPHPAWDALRTFAQLPVLDTGTHPLPFPYPVAPFLSSSRAPEEEGMEWPTPWKMDRSGTLEVRFRGTGLLVEAQVGPHWSTLWVEIDGQPAPNLPRDSQGRAYLNLYRPTSARIRVPLAHGLPLADHTLRFRTGPGDPIWPLTAVIVTNAAGEPGGSLPRGALHVLHRSPFLQLALVLVLLALPAIGNLQCLLAGFPRRSSTLLPLTAFLIPFTTRLIAAGPLRLVPTELPLILLLTLHTLDLARSPSPFAPLTSRSRAAEPAGERTRGAQVGDVVLALLLAALVTSTLHAADLMRALTAVRARVLFPVLFGVLLRRSGDNARMRSAQALVLGGLVLSLLALADIPLGRVTWVEGFPRLRAFFGSPNHLALVLVRVLPFTAALAILARGWQRILWRASLGMMMLTLLLTASRGAWLLAMPVMIAAWVPRGGFLGPENRGKADRFRAAIVWLSLVLLPLGLGVLLTLGRGVETGNQRLLIWQGTWRLIADRPWLGVGPGQFAATYPHYALPDAWREPLLYHAHNTFLTTAAVLGIPALFLLAGTLARVLLRPPSCRSPLPRAAWVSLLGGLAFGLVDAFWALDDLTYLTAFALAHLQPQAAARSIRGRYVRLVFPRTAQRDK